MLCSKLDIQSKLLTCRHGFAAEEISLGLKKGMKKRNPRLLATLAKLNKTIRIAHLPSEEEKKRRPKHPPLSQKKNLHLHGRARNELRMPGQGREETSPATSPPNLTVSHLFFSSVASSSPGSLLCPFDSKTAYNPGSPSLKAWFSRASGFQNRIEAGSEGSEVLGGWYKITGGSETSSGTGPQEYPEVVRSRELHKVMRYVAFKLVVS